MSKEQVFAEDMTEEMQAMAMESARNAFQRTYTVGNVYAQIAGSIRQEFDDKDGKGWNCVVGRSFGAFVTHKIKTYIYFSVSTAARMSVRVLPPLKMVPCAYVFCSSARRLFQMYPFCYGRVYNAV